MDNFSLAFHAIATFGALVWSRDEKQLVYIAERLPKDDDSKVRHCLLYTSIPSISCDRC
jgi:hypothetical protein